MDTSGFVEISKARSCWSYRTVLLSIKHIDEIKHKEITGASRKGVCLYGIPEGNQQALWIRYVVIPGLTDEKECTDWFLKGFPTFSWLTFCPITRWACTSGKPGLEYPPEGVSAPDKQSVEEIKDIFREHGLQVNLE